MTEPLAILAMGKDRSVLQELEGMLTAGGIRCIAVHHLPAAFAQLERAGNIGAAIVDCEPGSQLWKRVLAQSIQSRPIPLIVTSRDADETLWSEVLHYGGFDVLARPLRSEEVNRVAVSALRRGAAAADPMSPLVMRAG